VGSDMELTEYLEPLSFDAAFWLAGVRNPEYSMETLGDLTVEVCGKLRALGIMTLLTKADTDTFCHNLIRSGMARQTYLRRCRESGLMEDHHRASGRYEPLMDAIAAGDLGLAARIAALSPTDWMDGHEYEDDYCYAQLLHMLVAGEPDEAKAAALTARFEAYMEGRPNPRLDVARSLWERNQDGFSAGFEPLLRERETRIARDVERGAFQKPEVIAERRVFVEGLALLRLAEIRGLATETEYRFCPSLARRPMSRAFPGE
jgi:hypothetical protein